MQYTDIQKRLAVECLRACGYTPHPDERIIDWREYSVFVDDNQICFITNYCNVFLTENGEHHSVILNVPSGSPRGRALMEVWGVIDMVDLHDWKRIADNIHPSQSNRIAICILAAASMIHLLAILTK